jgi:hypothetical protein
MLKITVLPGLIKSRYQKKICLQGISLILHNRYANVTKEGEFIRAKNEKVAYGPMMALRASIVMSSF